MLKFFGQAVCALLLAGLAAGFMRGGAGPTVDIAVQPTRFTHVQIGGGGFVTGMSSVPSANVLLSRTDQYGCYLKVGAAAWKQLLTTMAMPSGSVVSATDGTPHTPSGNAAGCDEAIADPSNVQTLWIMYNANVYKSTNQGVTFAATGYPTQTGVLDNGTANSNAVKGMGYRIAVDPNNSSVVYASTFSGAPQRTIDGGTTFGAVSGITSATTVNGIGGGYLFAFDTSGGTTTVSSQTRTRNVYLSSYGTGVYKSTDGGQTWALTTGTPTTHLFMTADPFGNLWFVDNTGTGSFGTARKYNGTAWSAVSFTNSTLTVAVAYDPNNCASAVTCKIVYTIGAGNGTVATTGNGGSTWNVTSSNTVSSADVGWVASTIGAVGTFVSSAAFDNSGHFYTGSEGVLYTTPSTSGSVTAWTSDTGGIEEFLTNAITTGPNTSGSVIVAGWDVGGFTLASPYNTYPGNAKHGFATPTPAALAHGYAVSYAPAAPSTIVALADNQQGAAAGGGSYVNYSSKSSDGGVTWSACGAPSGVTSGGLVGGTMAASDATNFMWAPTDGSGGAVAPYYTTNGCSTWTQISVSGVTGGWPFSYSFLNHVIAPDHVAANTFWIYNWNTGSGLDAIIKCTGGGASCTNFATPGFSGTSRQYNTTLKAVPGQTGYLFLGSGQTAPSQGCTGTTGDALVYYPNSATKQTVSGITNVTAIGFGAAFPGHTFPTIVVAGCNSGTYGLYRSIDWDGAKTWQQIGAYPLGRPLSIYDIDGDKVTAGVFYYGTQSGVFCGAISITQCNGTTQ